MAHRRYIQVFPPVAHYSEVFDCYRAASARLDWLSAETWATWSADRPEWQDPDTTVVFWSYISLPRILEMIPPKRSAAIALRYSESIGEADKLNPGLAEVLKIFMSGMGAFDAVLVGSPSAEKFLKPYCRKIAVDPIGYDPGVMGTPDWDRAKTHDLIFYGSPYGRREWILPALQRHFGKRLLFVQKTIYGKKRKRLCDRCRATLYVGHSEEIAVPGFRIWQAVATSAALVTEAADAWPAVAGVHYVGIPTARKDHMDEFIEGIEKALLLPLGAIARRAHADLSKYTIEKDMEFVAAAL